MTSAVSDAQSGPDQARHLEGERHAVKMGVGKCPFDHWPRILPAFM